MDKTEYQIKLDEINRLIELQEYEEALEIIDTIEWKRVKSARTLCMVAEIYEINGELEDSMKILQLAYKRSSLGKTILYRQVELALKMKKYNDAVKYYNKYLEAASNDTTKYILKYKIYKAQKAPLEDLIAILEEYKEREYTERWVYELARLYKQAGNQKKCVETCDDLILWFGEGKYVMKAMELKMTYVPLSTAQKTKYEQFKKQEAAKLAKPAVKPSAGVAKTVGKTAADTVKPVMKPAADSAKAVVKPSVEMQIPKTNVISETVKTSVKPTVETVKSVKLPTDPAKSIVKPLADSTKPTVPQKKLVHPSFESISAAARNTSQKAPNFIKKELAFVPPVLEENTELLKEAAVTMETEKKLVKNDIPVETTEHTEVPVKMDEPEVVVQEDIKSEEISDEMVETKETVAEEEPSIESILAAAAAEIMAQKEAEEQIQIESELVSETPVFPTEPSEPTNHTVDNEELQKNLAKSLEQVFSGLHRNKMTQSFESFGRYIGSEMPKEILDEENMEDYLMKELTPENEDDTIISLDIEEQEAAQEQVEIQVEEPQEVEEPVEKPQEMEEQVEEPQEVEELVEESQEVEEQVEEPQEVEEQVEEPQEVEELVEELQEVEELVEELQEMEEQPEELHEIEVLPENFAEEEGESDIDTMEIDLEALFAETSSDFAKMIESFANENVGEFEEVVEPEATEEPVEEVVEPEISEEPVEEVVEPETSEEPVEEVVEPETSEEPVEEVVEPETSEEPAEEVVEAEEIEIPEVKNEDELDAEAAMLAFEASLLAGLNSISGLEDYTFDDLKESDEEIAEITEEISSEETAEESEEASSEEEIEESEEASSEEETEESEETSSEEEIEESEEASSEEAAEESEEASSEEEAEESEETSSEEAEEEISSEELTEDLEIKEIIVDDVLVENQNESISNEFTEENNGFDIDFEAQLVAETESFLGMNESGTEQEQEPEQEMDLIERLMMEADKEPSNYQSLADETPEDKRRRILNENCQTALTEEQKALFSYFCKVPGMNQQILDAINGVYRYADERTSRRGNIAIMGSHGMGKTRLGEGLVKAICKQFGIQAAKYARIDAMELNKKDIATVVGKMAGGFLIVERAHLMTPATIGQMATAMEFRTDSMVLIIEDEKTEMRQLLAEYPHFAEKFETVISIPVFTNDELVTFARTYAKENGFKMDELGVLALYALIGDNQREDEPVTIGRVKSMVDAAIRHATNARLGRRLSKRHVDESGRILLYEKDFED